MIAIDWVIGGRWVNSYVHVDCGASIIDIIYLDSTIDKVHYARLNSQPSCRSIIRF